MLVRLLGFTLGNVGGIAPTILYLNDDEGQPCVAMTPWLTPHFILISGFFHVNQGV